MSPADPRTSDPHATIRVARITVERVGPGLIVSVVDDAGHHGVGEAAPLPGYSTESLAQCRDALAAVDPDRIAVHPGRPLPPQVASHVRPLLHVPAAAFALETALLDVIGHRTGQPMHALLAPHVAAQPIALNALVADEDEAARAADAGFRCLKLKLGRHEPARERALARALRHRHGDAMALRFDANQRWGVDEAGEYLRALRSVSPEYVEEPSAATAQLTNTVVPLALDETLSQHPGLDLRACKDTASVCAVVLKPMRLGGALRCMDIAQRARTVGIDPVVTHMMDGPVALAAARALAFALAPSRACGLAMHAGLVAWPMPPDHPFAGAIALPGQRPGHGVRAP